MINFIKPQSFYPLALSDDGSCYPDHVLVSVRAYIADRKNETTATSSTSQQGHRIQASFFAAEPPRTLLPLRLLPRRHLHLGSPGDRVSRSHGNVILLATSIRSSNDPFGEDIIYDHFVYSADGTGGSSLDLLPAPDRHLTRANVGLVAGTGSHGGGYAVVALSMDLSGNRLVFHVHREGTARWSRKFVSRNKILLTESAGSKGLEEEEGLLFVSTKAITLQGSTIAWVDLESAALLCDVLADDDLVAYYIPLPEPLNDGNKEQLLADPLFFRNAIGRRDSNSIRLVEMEYGHDAGLAPGGWRAVTYSWTVGSEKWQTESAVDVQDMAKNSAEMLPLLCPDRSRSTVVVESESIAPLCMPTLCDRDDVLYLMSKPNFRSTGGSVVAVDTSKKTLESVTPMSEERVTGYAITFVHCTFSKCFFNGSSGIQ